MKRLVKVRRRNYRFTSLAKIRFCEVTLEAERIEKTPGTGVREDLRFLLKLCFQRVNRHRSQSLPPFLHYLQKIVEIGAHAALIGLV